MVEGSSFWFLVITNNQLLSAFILDSDFPSAGSGPELVEGWILTSSINYYQKTRLCPSTYFSLYN